MTLYVLSVPEIYDAYMDMVNGTDYSVFITQVPYSIFFYIMMLFIIFFCISAIICTIRSWLQSDGGSQ